MSDDTGPGGTTRRLVHRQTGARLLAFTLLPLTAACGDDPAAPDPSPASFAERLEAALDDGFGQAHGKGVGITVLVPGEPAWAGFEGISHGTVPITEGSVFAAGSITKTFTGLTILSLAEEGFLSLDDSLHAWFPPYPHVDPDITIRQLLNHTSGLSDFVDDPDWFQWLYANPDRVWGMEEFFLETIQPPYFEKGTHWSYSSSGYLLLRMLIEAATGSTVAQAYRSRVIEPLGLDHTFTCPEESLPSTWAHGWLDLTGDGVYDDFSTLPPTAFCSGAGGQVYSTPSDLARLARALMHDRSILNDASYGEMRDFYYPVGHDEPMVKGYGLGLMWFDESFTSGVKVWGHGGNAPGYAAGMLYLPDYGVSIGIMDNTEHGESMTILDRMLPVIEEHMQGIS